MLILRMKQFFNIRYGNTFPRQKLTVLNFMHSRHSRIAAVIKQQGMSQVIFRMFCGIGYFKHLNTPFRA